MTTGHYICGVKRKIHKEDILKAGLDLMFLNGYSATGIKEITEKVNIPKGSFYNHFASKEEFGLIILQQYCDNGAVMYKRRLQDNSMTPLERLDKFYSVMIENYRDVVKCKLGCIMGNFSGELADVNEKFRQLLDKEFDSLESIITGCIKEGQEAGEINTSLDPATLGSFLLNGWHGALIRMKSTGTVKPLEDFKTMAFILLKA